jgi:hypothetical protein
MAEFGASPSGIISLDCSTAYCRALVQQHLQGFDLVFSAGPYCRSAFHLRRLFNQSQAFPFDWWVTPASSLLRMLHPDYRFKLSAADVHLTQAAQVVFNSRDLILHLHDFERTADGAISFGQQDSQLENINVKYTFLFERLRTRLREAKRCLLIFEGLLPARDLEAHRQRTPCPSMTYPDLSPTFAPELAALLREAYGVEPTLVCFGFGSPSIESQPDLLRITAPVLSSPFDHEAEAWQRPWASFDLLMVLLSAAVSPEAGLAGYASS